MLWVVVALAGLSIVWFVVAVYTRSRPATPSKSGAGHSTYDGQASPILFAFYRHFSLTAPAELVSPLQRTVGIWWHHTLLRDWIGRVLQVSVGPGSLAAGLLSLLNSTVTDDSSYFDTGTVPGHERACKPTPPGATPNHEASGPRVFCSTFPGVIRAGMLHHPRRCASAVRCRLHRR